MPQIPSRLPREYESPSPDHRTWYTVVVNTVLRYSNVLHLHQRVCHQVGDTMVRTSRFTVSHRLHAQLKALANILDVDILQHTSRNGAQLPLPLLCDTESPNREITDELMCTTPADVEHLVVAHPC